MSQSVQIEMYKINRSTKILIHFYPPKILKCNLKYALILDLYLQWGYLLKDNQMCRLVGQA